MTQESFDYIFDPTTRPARRGLDDAEIWPDETPAAPPAEIYDDDFDGDFDDAPVPEDDDDFWGPDDTDDETPPKPTPSLWHDALGLFAKIAGVAIVFTLIFTFTHGIARNTDADMAPTIKAGDLTMFYRLDKNYQIDDLVVLRYQGQLEVRRVVAQAGDVVDITADGLTVNGALQQEPDINEPTQPYQTGIKFPVTVGQGQVFVLADARDGATDSRVYGPVNTKDTLGKVIVILKWRDL